MRDLRAWAPLLDGELASTATKSVLETGEALIHERLTSADYANGHAGVAQFFAHLARWTGEERFARAADDKLEMAAEAASEEKMGLGLLAGHSGVAWSLYAVAELLGETAESNATEELDSLLCEMVELDSWPGSYDLTSGLCGIGVYGFDHPDPRIRQRLVADKVPTISQSAIGRPGSTGRSWRPRPGSPTTRRPQCRASASTSPLQGAAQ